MFNKKLLDFIDDLNLLRSSGKINLAQIEAVRPFVMMYASMDPQQPQRMFDTYVVSKFGHHIQRRDEEFMLNESYADVQHHVSSDPHMDIIGMLKRDWQHLSAANKSAIWQHLQVLLLLNARCKQQQEQTSRA